MSGSGVRVGFAMFNRGAGAQGSAWISVTELFKCEEMSPPMREDDFSELCCSGLLHLTGLHIYQMMNVN